MAHAMIGLGKWLQREDWREPLAEVFVEHVGPACHDAGIEIDDLEETIGREAFIEVWGSACEDFMTRDLDDGRNVAENYLKRRGWKESPANREFIRALRHSTISLYEVVGVEPGRHFTIRDLLQGGEPVEVHEPDRSRHLELGEYLALRLVRVRQRLRTSEIILVFSPAAAQDLRERLDELVAATKAVAPEIAAELDRPDDVAEIEALTSLATMLPGAAPVFTDMWLRQVLDDLVAPAPPRIINSDGDDIEFAAAVYPLAEGVGDAELARVFADLPWIEPAAPPDEPPVQLDVDNPYDGWTITWHWVDHEAKPEPEDDDWDEEEEEFLEDGSILSNPKSPEGLPVLGDIARRGHTLRLAASTRIRLERGRAILEPALGDLVEPPEVTVKPMAEFVSEVFRLTRKDEAPAEDDRGEPETRSGT